jgi:predicted nucleic acid-binding Zn ribbon protein
MAFIMEPLAALAPAAIRALLRNGPMSPEKFTCAWRLAVGPVIDRATTASLGDDGTVRVVARGTAWHRELTRARPEITQKLRDLLGAGVVTRVAITGKDG